MTSTMLTAVVAIVAVGAIIVLVGRILRREKVVAYGVATIIAGVLTLWYDILALAF